MGTAHVVAVEMVSERMVKVIRYNPAFGPRSATVLVTVAGDDLLAFPVIEHINRRLTDDGWPELVVSWEWLEAELRWARHLEGWDSLVD